MGRDTSLAQLLVVTLVAGGIFYLPRAGATRGEADRSRPAPAAQAPANATGRPGEPSRPSSAVTAGQNLDDELEHPDAITLIGEYLGRDVDRNVSDDVRRAAACVLEWASRDLRNDGSDHVVNDRVVRALRALNLQAPENFWAHDDFVRQAARRALATSAAVAAPVDPSNCAVTSELASLPDVRARRLDSIRDAISRTSFMIATVPDPIESNSRWMFDPTVDAIQRATAASGYVLDRFYIPDWDPEKDAEKDYPRPAHSVHEKWPAVILFRGQTAKVQDTGLVVLFLVAETATSGIHQEAFDRAVETIVKFGLRHVRIIGPMFSGSVPSLATAISDAHKQYGEMTFRIVSGGATAADNGEILRGTNLGFLEDMSVDFQATVRSDEAVLVPLLKRLVDIKPSIANKVAFLAEANTGYGNSLSRLWDRIGKEHAGLIRRIGSPTWLQFPLHVSRLRSEADEDHLKAEAQTALIPSRFRPLVLGDPKTATDQIPSFSPKSTASSVELVLEQTLETIRREKFEAIGLLATDSRDKLYLAEQIARVTPSVTLFTLESDLLFIHPDYRPYLHGMLIGSTYPLFAQNQMWVDDERPLTDVVRQRGQFVSTNTEGVYNATIALLNYDREGTPLRRSDTGQPVDDPKTRPRDYRPPFENCPSGEGCTPPVWISIVGRDAIWPISAEQSRKDSNVQRFSISRNGPSSSGSVVPIRPSAPLLLLLACGSLVTLATCSAYAVGQIRAIPRPSPSARLTRLLAAVDSAGSYPFFSLFNGQPRQIGFELASLVPHCLSSALVASLVMPWATMAWPAWPVSVIAPCAIGLLAAAATCAVHALVMAVVRNRIAVRESRIVPLVALGLGCAVAVGLAEMWLIAFLGAGGDGQPMWISTDRLREFEAFAWFERSTALATGLSPLLPVMLLMAACYGWSLSQLLRVRRSAFWQTRGSSLEQLPIGSDTPLDGLLTALDQPFSTIPRTVRVTFMLAIAFTAVCVFRIEPTTTERIRYSQILIALWLAGQVLMVLALIETVWLWSALRRVLRDFRRHPMVGAYSRIPRDLFHNRFSPRLPELASLKALLRHGLAVGRHFDEIVQQRANARKIQPAAADLFAAVSRAGFYASVPAGVPQLLAPPAGPMDLEQLARSVFERAIPAAEREADAARARVDEAVRQDALERLEAEMGIASETSQPLTASVSRLSSFLREPITSEGRHRWSESLTWTGLLDVAGHLIKVLTPWWNRQTSPEAEAAELSAEKTRVSLSPWYHKAEELVAMILTLIYREVIGRIVNDFFFVLIALVLIVAAGGALPIQPRQTILAFAWFDVLLVVGAVFTVTYQIEHDDIICRLSRTDAGITWDRALLTRLVMYGAIPLLTLFATQFPDAGGTVLGWFTRMPKLP